MLRIAAALVLALGLLLPSVPALPAGAENTIVVNIDNPSPGEQNMSPGWIAGWAVDTAAPEGTGIDMVAIYMDGDQGTGTFLGLADYGGDRPDVAFVLGSENFRHSGFTFSLAGSTISPGPHSFPAVAHSLSDAYASASVANVTARQPGTTVTPPPPPSAAPSGKLQLNATLSNVSLVMGQNYNNTLSSFNG